MDVKAQAGDDKVATVYVAETSGGRMIEFVESLQPPIPREKKWVLIISTLHGCPSACRFCDAGREYSGKVSSQDMLAQVDYMIRRRHPDLKVPAEKFKIQFSRMGEPSFNDDVLDTLERLPLIYDAPGLIPALSTIAPAGTEEFFERLLEIKKRIYPERFQLQFSIHSTDEEKRNWLIPARKQDFSQIAEYGDRFYDKGGRKITLNFALAKGMPVEPGVLLRHFSPERYIIKITPVNPTCVAEKNRLESQIVLENDSHQLIGELEAAGYEVILSIGELEENHIGSNCGQYIHSYLEGTGRLDSGYNYALREIR
ncbi:MAG: radical SAM protein [Candidatus Krumholzibacteriota bacterium]|nr:radical SAM protein [Candidatus Krumholzibacteriota bacterium]